MKILTVLFISCYMLSGVFLSRAGLVGGNTVAQGAGDLGSKLFILYVPVLFCFMVGVFLDLSAKQMYNPEPLKLSKKILRTASALCYILAGILVYILFTMPVSESVTYHVGATIPVLFSFGLALVLGKFSLPPIKHQPVTEPVQLAQEPEIKTKAVQESDENIRFF